MQTRSILAQFSGQDVPMMEGLFRSPRGLEFLEVYDQREAEIEEKQQRVGFSVPHLAAARKKANEALQQALRGADVPAIMKFDACQIAKSAASELRADTGVKRLATHLTRIWERDPMGSFTVAELDSLREHYAQQFPKSDATSIIETEMPKRGFGDANINLLADAARHINSQGEYNNFVVSAGLDGDHEDDVRARALLKEFVNRRLTAQSHHDYAEVASMLVDSLLSVYSPEDALNWAEQAVDDFFLWGKQMDREQLLERVLQMLRPPVETLPSMPVEE